MKNNKGFSLVELIVVIAIMAILAAVAVVGVSIYIPKAQKASDDQLVADINYIFKTACLDAGVELGDVTAATWDAENWELDAVTITGDANGALAAKLVESFNDLYEVKNPEIKQEGYAIQYNGSKFVCELAGSVGKKEFIYNDNTFYYDQEDKDSFMNSYFGNDMTSKELLSDVDNVVKWAVNKLGGGDGEGVDLVFAGVEKEPEFLNFVRKTFGREYDELQDNQKVNAMILYTSNQTKQINSQKILNELLTTKGLGLPSKDLDNSVQMADYAMRYALALAFYRENNSDVENPSVSDVLASANDLVVTGTDHRGQPIYGNTTYFQEWLEEKGQTNVDGYLGAMDTISGNTDKIDADELLKDGFASDELVGMLDAFTGKNSQ